MRLHLSVAPLLTSTTREMLIHHWTHVLAIHIITALDHNGCTSAAGAGGVLNISSRLTHVRPFDSCEIICIDSRVTALVSGTTD